jgi:hypothetical protein
VTDPREEKLPAWAREELRKARDRADHTEKDLADHVASTPKSNVWHGNYGNRIYLPEHAVIHWQTSTEEDGTLNEIQAYWDVRHGLEIQGGSGIQITPSARMRYW